MKLLSVEQLRELMPISRGKLNQMVMRGEFVQPLQIAGQLMFVEDEVNEWMAGQPRGLFPMAEGLKKHLARKKGGAS